MSDHTRATEHHHDVVAWELLIVNVSVKNNSFTSIHYMFTAPVAWEDL